MKILIYSITILIYLINTLKNFITILINNMKLYIDDACDGFVYPLGPTTSLFLGMHGLGCLLHVLWCPHYTAATCDVSSSAAATDFTNNVVTVKVSIKMK